MAQFCLLPHVADQFKKDILDGKIDPFALAEMSSADRRAFFADKLGESNAEPVNALFESKLLLKNQQAGMITWAKKVMGENTQAGRDIISKIKRLDKVLDPADRKAFLEDLAAQRLGVHVTYEEAQTITELSKKVEDAKAALEKGGDRMDYGHAVVELQNHMADLKGAVNKFSKADLKAPGRLALKTINSIAGNAKALKASMDNSAIFRQGWRTLLTNPSIWQKNARQSFVDLVQQFGGKEVMNEVNADIVSRTNSLNGYYKKAKLDVGVVEEAYPTALPEKIPLIGRAYKASEAAFTAFVHRTRADVFDKYIEIAKRSDVNLGDAKELESIGRVVNSLTGRGHLGVLEPAAGVINNVFFSPRALKANIDTLLLHPTDKLTPFARKQAAYNLLKIIMGTAAILALAKALRKDSVEFDPRSSDFGKIKIGDTRFDVTAGMSSIITLAAREITHSTKSSTTGKVSKLNSTDFGSQTSMDVLYNFFENKLSPVAAVLKDIQKGQDFNGNKPTVKGELNNLFTPLPITTYQELKSNPNSANVLLSMIADGLGIAANTYSFKENWNNSTSKEMQEFKGKVGQKEFDKANDQYNQSVNKQYRYLLNDVPFKTLSSDEQQKRLQDIKTQIKKDIYNQYNFTPTTKYKNQSTGDTSGFQGLAGALNDANKISVPKVKPLEVQHTKQQQSIIDNSGVVVLHPREYPVRTKADQTRVRNMFKIHSS